MSKRFLCYETDDADRGKVNVDNYGVLSKGATIPSLTGNSANKQLVTDGDGNVKWEDRLAYSEGGLESVICASMFDAPAFYWQMDTETHGYYSVNVPDFPFVPSEGEIYQIEWDMEIFNVVCKQKTSSSGSTFYDLSPDPDRNISVGENKKCNLFTGSSKCEVIKIYRDTSTLKQIDPKYLPVTDSIVVNSSTAASTKKFKITVDDSGTISATEVT